MNPAFIEGVAPDCHVLSCSNCDAHLCEVQVVAPDPDLRFTYVANCPFCGDVSWELTVAGAAHAGSIALPNPDDPKDSRLVTRVVDQDLEGEDRVRLTIMREGNAQPVRSR